MSQLSRSFLIQAAIGDPQALPPARMPIQPATAAEEPQTSRRALLAFSGAAVLAASGLSGCASRSARRAGSGGRVVARSRAGEGPRDAPREVSGRVDDAVAMEVALAAVALVDTPYRYGGNTPQGGFDCSGLIVYVYRQQAGWPLPRTVAQLARTGQPVHYDSVRAGDLLVFDTIGPDTHAGIYVGGERFVHAPSSGGVVRLEAIGGPYWWPRFTGVRRI